MSTMIKHRRINIITLARDESIAEHCKDGDIAIRSDDAGWWILFVGAAGETSGYEAPFESYEKALWTAKAAAEFAAD